MVRVESLVNVESLPIKVESRRKELSSPESGGKMIGSSSLIALSDSFSGSDMISSAG